MSYTIEHDPDVLRDSMRDDDMPPRLWSHGLVPALPLRPMRTEEDAERDLHALRRRAERLYRVLEALTRDEAPTLPDDEGAMMALIVALEDRIARAANEHGCHRYARRAPGRPIACARCARPIDRAAEACFA